MIIFGKPWDAPICDDADVLPEVPTYADCLRCSETFTEGDAGVVMPTDPRHVDPRHLVGVGGQPGYALVAEHRECFLAGVAGHLVGVCTCTGWDSTSRAAGLEVQRRADLGALDSPTIRRRLIDTPVEADPHVAGPTPPSTPHTPARPAAGRGPSAPRHSGHPHTEETATP